MTETSVLGIDASRVSGRARTGTENYSVNIIRHLLAQDVPWRWRLYTNGHGEDVRHLVSGTDAGFEVQDIPFPRLWTHVRLSRELVKCRPAGLFIPAHVVPAIHPPTVVTIHDLGYLHEPDAHPRAQRKMLDITTRWSARVARHIIVPSRQTQSDLATYYGVPDDRITIIPHGIDTRFSPGLPDSAALHRYDLGRPYILAVGTLQPRKNYPLLARAMTSVDGAYDLVIAGKRGWMADKVIDEIQNAGLGNRLQLLEYVSDEVLIELYKGATAFVQPSHFEGFGMPVLEAMASGTPVITTGGSSLDELASTAALVTERDNTDQLAQAITRIVSEPGLRKSLSHAGVVRSAQYSWDGAARKTRMVLEEYCWDSR